MTAFSGSGAGVLVATLRRLGVRRIYGVPGESFVSVLDELSEANDIDYVIARQEGGASMMADAEGKLTGEPGVLMLARGPGAANAMAGLHVAHQDSTPLVVFVGLIPRGFQHREAFQEIDIGRFFGGVAKWAITVDDASRLPELVTRAYAVARSGRPGPVVIGLPEDMLTDAVTVHLASEKPVISLGQPDPGQVADVVAALNKSRRPLVIAGGHVWSETARHDLERVAAAATIPMTTSFRCQDHIDNLHDGYAGHLGIAMDPNMCGLVKNADLILAIGSRLDEHTTGSYTLLDAPAPAQTLVHVHPDGAELHKIYQADIPLCCDPRAFVAALAASTALDGGAARRDWYERAGGVVRSFRAPKPIPGDVQLAEVIHTLRAVMPETTVVSNGAGNYAGWVHRYFAFRQYGTQLAPVSGSMGYGLPAAIAAALVEPSRPAVAVAGDGCVQMTIQELATAAMLNLPILLLVINNGSYGAIRMHQEKAYPERVYATDIDNPDFAAVARAYGWSADVVDTTEAFRPALERARETGGPALIELRVPVEALTSGASLTEIRERAKTAR